MNSLTEPKIALADLRTDSDRLWDSLMEMAKLGATAKGGVNRQALTDLEPVSYTHLTLPTILRV